MPREVLNLPLSGHPLIAEIVGSWLLAPSVINTIITLDIGCDKEEPSIRT